tara:strand:+ start:2223 stop:3041 length:819 start_codon:yes stop_codon:yes gene_type:complete
MDGIDIIYWINLPKSKERRAYMKNILADEAFDGIVNERVDGTDGIKNVKKLHEKLHLDKMDFMSRNLQVTSKEYACTLSHLEAIRKFSLTDYTHAIILEDDISLEYKKYWNETLKEVMNDAPKDWEILKIQRAPYSMKEESNKKYKLWDFSYRYNEKFPKDEWWRRITGDWGAAAYIINNVAAKKLIKNIYKNGKYVLKDNLPHFADAFLFKMLKTYIYKYPFFTPRKNNDTNIQPGKSTRCREKVMDEMYKRMTRKNKKAAKQTKKRKSKN